MQGIPNSQQNEDNPYENSNNTSYDHIQRIRCKFPKYVIFSHVNINSIRHKWKHIFKLLSDGLVDVISISETKLDDSFPQAQFKCEGFTIYRQDRTCSGGGIMTCVRGDIPQRRLYDLESKLTHIETTVIELRVKKEKWYLITVYNPNRKHESELVTYLNHAYETILNDAKEIICLGDLNVDLLLPRSKLKEEVFDVLGLHNIISTPTC